MAHIRAGDDFKAIRAPKRSYAVSGMARPLRKQTAHQSSPHGGETTRHSSVFADS